MMPGRESEYTRGYIRGISSVIGLLASNKVKKLDRTNIMQYAKELVNKHMEENK
jgi:hypothetical protein